MTVVSTGDAFDSNLNPVKEATIRILYYPNSPHLEQTSIGNWIDTYVYEDVTLKKGDFKYIPLGFACQLPDGYEAYIEPRSSTYKRWGLQMANEMGIVDTSFCSNSDQWMFPAIATRDVTIPKGTRICQFRIQESQPRIVFEEVSDLGNKARGGLGSTGL